MPDSERRRRRHRHTSGAAAGPPAPGEPVADTSAVLDPEPESGRERGGRGDDTERGLRGLVGAGSSQVSVGAALRARDAARPTEAHLVDAEAHLHIVRRGWVPREELPRGGR
ncbi:hypothetical protein [Rhizomonospora bruguierae]|uniref:hypothetical protein n=1 Tax=Rhizomonospora bruguierae TaxID=1581705 RepID=UPI001BCF91BC|nr:hypothetical protein [Micromonospora sp. NBRC 107566]